MFSTIFSFQIHHFLDFVKTIYKDLSKVVVSTSAAGCFARSPNWTDTQYPAILPLLFNILAFHSSFLCLLISLHVLQ